jgi:hypothetical protein
MLKQNTAYLKYFIQHVDIIASLEQRSPSEHFSENAAKSSNKADVCKSRAYPMAHKSIAVVYSLEASKSSGALYHLVTT